METVRVWCCYIRQHVHRIRCLGTVQLELGPVHYWFMKEISVQSPSTTSVSPERTEAFSGDFR